MKVFLLFLVFLSLEDNFFAQGDSGIFQEEVCQSCQRWCDTNETKVHKEIESCRGAKKKDAKERILTGGIFNMRHPTVGSIEVFCDTTTDGGGWLVFQRRMNGIVDFYQKWEDYVNGFGDKREEFWFGLETIHQMTKNNDMELRIDMVAVDGTRYYAKYRTFSIGPASSKYQLKLQKFSGNTRDSLLVLHNGNRFTTKDADNGYSPGMNCARRMTGAWWYNTCLDSDLNGVFHRRGNKGIFWRPHFLKFTEMKFRRRK